MQERVARRTIHTLFASFFIWLSCFAPTVAQQGSGGIYLLNQDRLFSDSAFGIRVAEEVRERGTLIAEENETKIQELEQEEASNFKETVQRVYGIITIEHLVAREQDHDVTIELVISVNPRISILEAQEIANRAKTLLLTRFSHVKEVQIQAIPYDPGYPYKSNHELPDHEATLIQ